MQSRVYKMWVGLSRVYNVYHTFTLETLDTITKTTISMGTYKYRVIVFHGRVAFVDCMHAVNTFLCDTRCIYITLVTNCACHTMMQSHATLPYYLMHTLS